MRSWIVAALVAWATLARAESPVEAEARRLYTSAQKSFDAARYADALVEFGRSYELSGYPAILYKMALCHDQLGHAQDALDAYRQYLAADPTSERRAGVEERMHTLEQSLRPKEPPPAPVVAVPPIAPQPQLKLQPQPLPPPPPGRTPIYKRWWLWTIVGVAVAGGAVGLGVGLGVKSSPTPDSFVPTLGRFGPALGVR